MELKPEERRMLLSLARSAVEACVRGQALPCPPCEGVLAQSRGCFVTLTNSGMLRGCIGTFGPDGPLGQTLVEMAQAATRDPRFLRQPITPAELPSLTVGVSILSPLVRTTEPEKLIVGTHGIYVIHRHQAGCFLPEVATEMGWSAREFLDHCCMSKAGLARDAWRSPEAQVYLFTSDKFEG
ncbi:MAG: AmmeMemoRadiSam system protein A [Planctomycetes bacterium]|nr:AmmeMemoRadiSam system protein A [Planctomycetota bacterium]